MKHRFNENILQESSMLGDHISSLQNFLLLYIYLTFLYKKKLKKQLKILSEIQSIHIKRKFKLCLTYILNLKMQYRNF